MDKALTELCAELRNWFVRDVISGTFVIADGALSLPELLTGQYFRIVGSVLNDGVCQNPAEGLADETFTGEVWAMAVPPAVVDLAKEIKDWREDAAVAAALKSPYTSESFSGYSYTKGGYGSGESGYGWQQHFATRLRKWRKL